MAKGNTEIIVNSVAWAENAETKSSRSFRLKLSIKSIKNISLSIISRLLYLVQFSYAILNRSEYTAVRTENIGFYIIICEIKLQ